MPILRLQQVLGHVSFAWLDSRGRQERLRADMQVRPVRMKESRAIIGAQRPLQRQSHRSLPPHPRYARLVAGSAPPPAAKPLEPPPSPSLRSSRRRLKRPLHWHCHRSLPQSRLRSCVPFADRPLAPRIELLAANSGSSYWGSRRPLHRRKPAEPPLHKKEETQRPDLTGYWIG